MTPRRYDLHQNTRCTPVSRYLYPAVTLFVGVFLLMTITPLHAQDSGQGFFFKQPAGSITLRGGLALAGTGGESSIYAFTRRELTLGRNAFDSPAIGADLSFRLAPRLDLVFGGAYSGTSKRSEFRDWVGYDDLPIEQTTSLRRVPLTVGLKAYLTPRGHSIGQFAWIPARYAVYVGAGAGTMWYQFRQHGEFVDFDTPTYDIFASTFESSRWTTTGHALAGVDYSLSPRLALTAEGRYILAKADMSSDFVGFDPIDLSGFSATIGLSVRF